MRVCRCGKMVHGTIQYKRFVFAQTIINIESLLVLYSHLFPTYSIAFTLQYKISMIPFIAS